jgi:uncharacterized membrane protein
MIEGSERGVPSKAAIGGHPLHPMIVPFPIAFLVGALCSDLAYWGTGDPFWARASIWLVGAGLVTGAAAGALGLIDFTSRPRIRELGEAWGHAIGNVVALLITAINLGHRIGAPDAAILPWGLVLSAIVVGVLLVTGWLGGELAYRHRIGVADDAAAPAERVGTYGADPAFAGRKPDIGRDRR